MIECPRCKNKIDPNSAYCDQCGLELRICPQCGKYGKANRCTQCGSLLISPKDNNDSEIENPQIESNPSDASNAEQQTPISQKMNTTFSQRMSNTYYGRTAGGSNMPLYLVSYVLGVRLPFIDGGVIGRNTGDYMSTFCTQGYVSGTHAKLQLDKSTGNWTITDLGSRNGTYLNGKKLIPHTPEAIWRGALLRIATTDFIVE